MGYFSFCISSLAIPGVLYPIKFLKTYSQIKLNIVVLGRVVCAKLTMILQEAIDSGLSALVFIKQTRDVTG